MVSGVISLIRADGLRRMGVVALPLLALAIPSQALGSPGTAWRQVSPERAPALESPIPSQADVPTLAGTAVVHPVVDLRCPPARASQPLSAEPPPAMGANQGLVHPPASAAGTPPAPLPASAAEPAEATPGYAASLRSTPFGWPRLSHWCVWIEPPTQANDPWERRWYGAVLAALDAWRELLPLWRVEDRTAAQLRVWRRSPPLARDPAGRTRASHGRALLQVVAVERLPGQWRLEPSVEVLLSPGQRSEALQATAVHELGHGFGLWGHSPDAADALAASPGPVPVLKPSARDRATLEWLQRQPTPFGHPLVGRPLAPPLPR